MSKQNNTSEPAKSQSEKMNESDPTDSTQAPRKRLLRCGRKFYFGEERPESNE